MHSDNCDAPCICLFKDVAFCCLWTLCETHSKTIIYMLRLEFRCKAMQHGVHML